jgi:hypothetical protein
MEDDGVERGIEGCESDGTAGLGGSLAVIIEVGKVLIGPAGATSVEEEIWSVVSDAGEQANRTLRRLVPLPYPDVL